MNLPVQRSLVANYVTDRLQALTKLFHPGTNTKHDHYTDFGWPANLTFHDFYKMYKRNGLATAAVEKTKLKTWQDDPQLWETEVSGDTAAELRVKKWADELRVWHHFAEADKRSMVGRYAGVIMRIADGRNFDLPVGEAEEYEGLVELIPAWEGQLRVATWHDDINQPDNYGKPKMFEYNERGFGSKTDTNVNSPGRNLRVHPDRIIIWSDDGTLNCRSTLESGYNDLIDAEKVKGAGGEGFWKNSRGAPVITAAEGVKPGDVAKAMGIKPEEVVDEINKQIDSFQQGYDKGLLLGGMTATPLSITLPSPEHFFAAPVQSFAASMCIPIKILMGSQTGERASTEDAREWNQTNMARRTGRNIPLIRAFVRRMAKFGILPEIDWTVGWADLTEAVPSERLARAKDMATINQQHKAMLATTPSDTSGEGTGTPGKDKKEPTQNAVKADTPDAEAGLVFDIDEIREVAGYKPRAKGKRVGYDQPTAPADGMKTSE